MKIDKTRRKTYRERFERTKEGWRNCRQRHFRHKGSHGKKVKKLMMNEQR